MKAYEELLKLYKKMKAEKWHNGTAKISTMSGIYISMGRILVKLEGYNSREAMCKISSDLS